MRFRIGLLTTVLMLVFPRSARVDSNSDSIVSACAAFGTDGSSATATSDNSHIKLEVDDSGAMLSLTAPVRYPLRDVFTATQVARRYSSCRVYFSHDNQYVAFGFQSQFFQPRAAYLQVIVADLQSRKWVGNWGVEPQPESPSTISLAGFLEGTDSLVVTAKPYDIRAVGTGENATVETQLFNPSGQLFGPRVTFQSPSETTDAFRHFADATHNRLWSFSCADTRVKPYNVPLCPVSVTELVAEQRKSLNLDFPEYRGKRDDLWEWPEAFAAIDANTILIAETVGGADTIWTVNMPSRAIDRFVLPHHHFVKYNGLGPSSLSSDAEVYGVLLKQLELAFPYLVDNYVFRGTDVVIMQTHPMRLLATIPHRDSSFTAGLAVDHRDGKARILVYRQNHWEHQEFADTSSDHTASPNK